MMFRFGEGGRVCREAGAWRVAELEALLQDYTQDRGLRIVTH